MNKEIKEILDYMKEYIKPFNHDSEPMLNSKDIKILLDYITNLQQELNEYKFPNCKTKDIEVVRANLVDMMRKNKRLEQENERLKKELKDRPFMDYTTDVYEELEDYKSKFEKTIEYVNFRIEEFKNAGSSRKEIKAHHYYMLLCDIEKILNSSL